MKTRWLSSRSNSAREEIATTNLSSSWYCIFAVYHRGLPTAATQRQLLYSRFLARNALGITKQPTSSSPNSVINGILPKRTKGVAPFMGCNSPRRTSGLNIGASATTLPRWSMSADNPLLLARMNGLLTSRARVRAICKRCHGAKELPNHASSLMLASIVAAGRADPTRRWKASS